MSDQKLRYYRLFFLFALAFLTLFSYGLALPAIESLFIQQHTSKALPNVWILMSLTMIIVVSVYNRFLLKVRLMRLFTVTALIVALLLMAMIAGAALHVPGVYYALYIWKDIYIILFVELFYSYTNSVYLIKEARWHYGFFGGMAALGSVVGGLLVGLIAKWMGTVTSLWVVVAVLFLIALVCLPFSRVADSVIPEEAGQKKSNMTESVKTVLKSSYLVYFLLMIVVVQLSITLIDFEYNAILEKLYPVLDQRTVVMGKIYSMINMASFALHLLTGFILRIAGIPLVLVAIPVLISISLGFFMAAPGFITIAVLKVSSKGFDYSIFRSARECLYIPLSYEERAQGKSIIDMIVYRVGKVGASMMVKVLILLSLSALVDWMVAACMVGWLLLTAVIVRRFRRLVPREKEMKTG